MSILLLAYAFGPLRHNHAVRARFVLGALLLTLSIPLRSIDNTVCGAWPVGTHFVWHLLNGLVLGRMIEVYRRAQVN